MHQPAPATSTPGLVAIGDLADRLRVIAETVSHLLDRIDLLEAQRQVLASRLSLLETRP